MLDFLPFLFHSLSVLVLCPSPLYSPPYAQLPRSMLFTVLNHSISYSGNEKRLGRVGRRGGSMLATERCDYKDDETEGRDEENEMEDVTAR